MNKLRPCLAALGLSAALAAGSASAAIIWNPDFDKNTLFEDDDIDFIYDSELNPKAGGIIEEGDVFISIFELHSGGGGDILPKELAGVVAVQVDLISDPDPITGTVSMLFGAYDGGLDAILAIGSTDQTVTGGGAGGGALTAIWLTDDPDLDIGADFVVAGTVSCDSLGQCIDQAVGTDDTIWEVDGFTGPDGTATGDEFWFAAGVERDTSIVLATEPGLGLGTVNAGVSILENGTGENLAINMISCFPLCGSGAGADGFVDVIGTGKINGGLGLTQNMQDTGAVATSDFDLEKKRMRVPEPSTLALMAGGLLGVGAAKRRRRKA